MAIEFPCDACGKQLRVPDGSGGKQAKCPHCATVARVPADGGNSGSSQAAPQSSSSPLGKSNDDDPLGLGSPSPSAAPQASPQRPQASSAPYPAKTPAAGGNQPHNPYLSAPASSSPYQANYGNAGRASFSNFEMSHRGGMVLTLGILSIVFPTLAMLVCCCCPLIPGAGGLVGLGLGIPALLMGKRDLKLMDEGRMDPSGRGMTNGGMICGIIGTILGGLTLLVAIAFTIMQGISAVSQPNSFGNDPFADDPFSDDPFADDPFADDTFGGDF